MSDLTITILIIYLLIGVLLSAFSTAYGWVKYKRIKRYSPRVVSTMGSFILVALFYPLVVAVNLGKEAADRALASAERTQDIREMEQAATRLRNTRGKDESAGGER